MSLDDLDLDDSPATRTVDRSGQMHESSEGVGHRCRRLTTGVGEIDPFLTFEEFWIEQAGVEPAPRAGVSIFSYVFADSPNALRVRDSYGGDSTVLPGALLVTHFGNGMLWEQTPSALGTICNGLNVVVNLPAGFKDTTPSRALRSTLPEVSKGSLIHTTILAGEFEGKRAPTSAGLTPTILDVAMMPGASFRYPLPREHTAVVIVLRGKAVIGSIEDSRTVRAGVGVSLFDDGDSISVRAADEKCRVLIATAKRLGDPVFTLEGFVMNHPQQLADMQTKFESGGMGMLAQRES